MYCLDRVKKSKKAISFVPTAENDETHQNTPAEPVHDNRITMPKIQDFCEAILKNSQLPSSSGIGRLDDSIQGLSHYFWTCPPLTTSYILEPLSLKDILFPDHLDEFHRLQLGVKIASAVIHLHTTEWLSTNWGCKNVFFLQKITHKLGEKGEPVRVREHALEMPFVQIQRDLEPSEQYFNNDNTAENTNLVEYDETLFCLGIVLI